MRLKTPLLLLAVFALAICQQVDYNPGVQNSPGLLSDQARIPFATFYAACSAATSAHKTLAVTKVWTVATSATCSAGPLSFFGGTVKPASGQTVTFSVGSAPLSKICDTSLGGKCIINTPNAEIYPEWWGAVAGQDSTVAFQAALNMISSTTKSMKLMVPNNNVTPYQISTTLTYTGSSDFGSSLVMEGIVSGAGGRGSILLWTGASGGILIHVTDCHKCRINHVSFQGNALALTDFWLDASDTVGSTQSADDSFDDVSLSGMTGTGSAGLRISHTGCTDADVAEIAVRNSQIIGNNFGIDTGVSYECGGNSKNITFDNNVISSLGTGIFAESSGFAWVNLHGNYFSANGQDWQVPLGSVNVIGGGSEGSSKMFDMGAGQNICNLTMIGFYWAGNTISNDNIGTSSGCSIDISGSKFVNGRTPTSLPRIVLSGGFPPLGCTGAACGMPSLTSHANFFLNADTTHGAYYDNGGSPLGVYYGTYAANSVNINQAPIQVWGDYGGVSEALKFPLPNYSFAQPRILTPTGPTGPCTPPQITYDAIGNEYRCPAVNTWIASGPAASYIATESGSNNAIAGTPAFPPALAAGLQLRIKLAHSLQAGANTFAYNGGSALAIKSSRNPANDIATADVSGGFVNLLYTGSVWVDTSQ